MERSIASHSMSAAHSPAGIKRLAQIDVLPKPSNTRTTNRFHHKHPTSHLPNHALQKMGWINRFGNAHHPTNALTHSPLQIRHILAALLCLTLLLSTLASFPLLILFLPSPSRFPPNIHCATCSEIAAHNPVLARYGNGGAWMACLGPLDEVDRGEGRDVVYGGMERCWVREEGLDEWLRPVGVSYEDIVKIVGEGGRI